MRRRKQIEGGSANILLARAGMLPALVPVHGITPNTVTRAPVHLSLSGTMPDSAGNMPAIRISYERIASKRTAR